MLNTSDSIIICIDVQEKLVNMLNNSNEITSNCTKLMNVASILNIDTIITEQYPKGLGQTITPISSIKNFNTLEKTTFSALKTENFKEELQLSNKKQVIIFGIETHICVLQSVLDLLNENYEVFVVSNCCSSRDKLNHDCAIELMKQYGAKITTLEIVLFDFLKSSKHPNFKEVQALIK